MTPNAQDRLRSALMKSERWVSTIKEFNIMTLAMFPPLSTCFWDEEDEDNAYLWIEGKIEHMPRKMLNYIVQLRQFERNNPAQKRK